MKSRRVLFAVVLILGMVMTLAAQDSNRALQAYQDRFRDATPEIKLQILETADALSVAELGPLYEQGLQFGLSNSDRLSSDIEIQQIVLFSVDKVREGGYSPAAASLWSVFTEWPDNTARIAILNTFSEIAVGDDELILDLNGWVQAQTNLYRGGVNPDLQVLNAAVATLGALGDVSSFSVLLDVQLAQISATITSTARNSMKALSDNYVQLAVDTINRRTISNQLSALEFFLGDPDLTESDRAAIATGVMAQAVRTSTRDVSEQRALREVRFRAARELIEIPHQQAAGSLVRHFNQTFQVYDQGIIAKTWVLEAIAALGSTGSPVAAERLTEFLDLLNTYTENSRPYDTQITLAVITNLERLADVGSYDALFYVTLLNYPQRVKDAARSAMNALNQ